MQAGGFAHQLAAENGGALGRLGAGGFPQEHGLMQGNPAFALGNLMVQVWGREDGENLPGFHPLPGL